MTAKYSSVILKLLCIVMLWLAVAAVAKLEPNSAASTSNVADGGSATTSSTPTSATKSPTATTTGKPKAIIQNIPTFDFSIREVKPKKEVVKSCNKNDRCHSMNGFCIRGTCKTKECSTEIYCVCDHGFTGHICDKNITEIALKNGKGNGNGQNNHAKTSTKLSKNGSSADTSSTPQSVKEQAKGAAAKDKTLVNGILKTASATNKNKTLKHGQPEKVSNTSKGQVKTDLVGTTEKQVANKKVTISNKKNLSNDQPMLPPKPKVLSNAKTTLASSPIKTDNVDTKSKSKDKVLANGDININLLNTKHDTVDRSQRDNNVKDNTKPPTKESSGRARAKFVNEGSKTGSVKETKSKHDMNKVGATVTSDTISKVPSDGSYVKGPELHVPTEHSVVDFTEHRREINKGKQSFVKEHADIVTIRTTSVEQMHLRKSPEMLTSGARDSLRASKNTKTETKTKTVQNKERKIRPLTKSSKNKSNSNFVSVLNETPREKSPLNIVSSNNIVERNPITVTEEAGSVKLRNNTVIEANPVLNVSPLLTNSEIKITIETSNTDSVHDNKTASKNSLALKPKNSADITKGRNKATTNNENTGSPEKRNPRKTNIPDNLVLTETTNPVGKTTFKRTNNADKPASKRVGSSQNSEIRKSTQSEILNPIMQLMNIFRSEKFVKNVSAVKIEIITKQNKTESQPSSTKNVEQINKSSTEKKSPEQTKDTLV